ncbi:MAG: hypothetical protein J5962_03795, partial [Lachnospiraceae bacterium]|nr:hypothetical protein [Lachnospiraceae bacterium]
MQIENLFIIPDRDNLESYIMLAEEYGLGFEYNDFFLPSLLDNEDKLENTIQLYKETPGIPNKCTSHGAFFDV